jgi:hypothetical protein
MPVDPLNAVIHGIGHAIKAEHKKGNHGKANAWSLIVFGVFLLPLPIIGIPLLIAGIWKLCS